MKRRQRRPVLTFNKPQGSYHGEHSQSKCKSNVSNIDLHQPVQNEANNPLANMLCQYNSDSDTEDSKKDTQKLDDQVNDFFKEIQFIAPEQPIPNIANEQSLAIKTVPRSARHTNQRTLWQECYDESTGYPYYWHIETNEVTWDMPEELRLLQKQSEARPRAKHPIQGSHWVNFSSIEYRQSQTNIPEGMIPQEVVARNRNRFLHNETSKKCNSESTPEINNDSPTKDDDCPEDGRIEMITSFGSDGSDSEDENNSSDENKISPSLSESGKSNSTSYVKSGEIGPVFCPTEIQSPIKNLFHSYKSDSTDVSNSTNHREQLDEREITKYDNKTSVVQGEKESLMENKNKKDINIHNTIPKGLNVSLVPGYGDDSDGEEEVKLKQEIKPLFPIAQNEEYINATNSLKNIHDVPAKNSGNVQASDQCSDVNEDNQETKNDNERIEEKESKLDEDKSKTNIFLEDMQVCGKAFQRKKRIAFDVTSTKKVKQSNNTYQENTIRDDNSSDFISNETTSRNTEDDAGINNQFCAENQRECDEAHKEEQCISIKTEEKINSKDELCDLEVPTEHKTISNIEGEKANEELNNLSQIITEKLKFLSEGRETVSAVQTMQIQLQTLSTAWTASSLEDSYFQKWLTDTNHELERLEQDAAPAGWLCQWDRSHKRYYYHNTSTGTLQWTYPDTGIAGGTEEMELCTTPPPESEESLVTELSETKKIKEKQTEEMDDNKADEENIVDRHPAILEAPSPPQISNPSPPPPPRIFAEDLKKDKRKRDKSDDTFLDEKRKRLEKDRTITTDAQVMNPTLESLSYAHPQVAVSSQTSISLNHTNMEPLPPGVDLPETSYEAATLKGIIYNTASQSSNAIYAPSIADPTIPILNHQAGLLQESFVHYPTFHQHLHNTIAVANKHSGQSAIQFMVGYAPIYTNNKIIAKPPVKASKESLGSALDSFYNDIARIEKTETERTGQPQDIATTITEQVSISTEEAKPEVELETVPGDITMKERKKKKARLSNSKKHKEMSSMVAKWQRVQKNLEDTV
ncbi:PREDICTED: formin-binding protein 4-like [Cyphomyrmex costatus]|uniref:Formin-binding protein 4 n=1 Tax=Cyphomyrmex costatus TaxID=456900 RepID=A0A195CP00_9HYME|nr:PREDICTED: formin-binding protein 4-like [Cyphomyrmex costatus]KYN02370.1 Formin-binding protein 4 [Cyphomyrmex costatus]